MIRKGLPRKSISRKRVLAGLVSLTVAAALALGSAALAGSAAPPASGSAKVHATVLAQAKQSIPPALKTAMETLTQHDFIPGFGFEDTYWRRAVAMSAVEAYQQTTGDTSYEGTFSFSQLDDAPVESFEDNYNDDTAWWGLALLQGYSITHNAQWLQYAEDIANYIAKTWNNGTTDCCEPNSTYCFSGGVPWERSGPNFGYSGAIQNTLFLELTAWLHNTIGHSDSTYLDWALKEWKFLQDTGDFHSNPISVPGGFGGPPVLEPYWVPNASPDLPGVSPNNPATPLCGGDRYRVFTYNQGVFIAGLVQLYKATNDNLTYLKDAEDIANAVLKTPTPAQVAGAVARIGAGESPWIFTFPFSGVLIEPQDAPAYSQTCCLGDGAAFKGILVRDLRMLDDTITSASTPETANSGPQCAATYNDKSFNQCATMYNDFFTTQACSIEANDTSTVSGYSINPGSVALQQYQVLGDHWTGPSQPADPTTQVSGVEALVAADHEPAKGTTRANPFPNCRATRRSAQPGHTSPAPSPSQASSLVKGCYDGWYRMPYCEDRGWLVRGWHFYARRA